MQAANRLLELAVNARSEARDAYRVYRSRLRHRGPYQREVLPLRQDHLRRTLLRYNAMLIDVFSLPCGGAPAHCSDHHRDRGEARLLASHCGPKGGHRRWRQVEQQT